MDSASSSVLRPGATCRQSSCPKYECVEPDARIRASYGRSPTSSVTTLRSTSIAQRLAQQNLHVRLTPQDVTNGRCDVARGQPGGGHLIEQWLEQVVVAPIDDHDVDARPLQGTGRAQAPNPPPTITTRGRPVARSGRGDGRAAAAGTCTGGEDAGFMLPSLVAKRFHRVELRGPDGRPVPRDDAGHHGAEEPRGHDPRGRHRRERRRRQRDQQADREGGRPSP